VRPLAALLVVFISTCLLAFKLCEKGTWLHRLSHEGLPDPEVNGLR